MVSSSFSHGSPEAGRNSCPSSHVQAESGMLESRELLVDKDQLAKGKWGKWKPSSLIGNPVSDLSHIKIVSPPPAPPTRSSVGWE